MPESKKEYNDELVKRLQQTVEYIKRDREMEERYMLLEELMDEEYNKGRAEAMAEAVIKFLSKYSDIPETVRSGISAITDIDKLEELFETLLNLNSEEEVREFIRNL